MDKTTEAIHILTAPKVKTWLKNMANNAGQTMTEYIQIHVIERVWESLQTNCRDMAAIETGCNEFGIPFSVARKLSKAEEVLALIPKSKHKDFEQRFFICYDKLLKNEMKEMGFEGYREEIQAITGKTTMEEWEKETGFKADLILHKTKDGIYQEDKTGKRIKKVN